MPLLCDGMETKMTDTFMTCITQLITTILTIAASILIAYLTYRSQKKKSLSEIKRLQSVNCHSALELFNAYIANLIFFVAPEEKKLNRNTLLTCLDKMKLLEQYLSELTEVELPDDFIRDFQFYRLKISFQRLSLENCLSQTQEDSVDSSLFIDLNTFELITSLNVFISKYSKTEG